MRRRRRARKRQEKREEDRRPIEYCPSAIVQGEALRKNELECPGSLGTSERPTAISTQSKRGWGPHDHVETAVDLVQSTIIC